MGGWPVTVSLPLRQRGVALGEMEHHALISGDMRGPHHEVQSLSAVRTHYNV